MIVRLLILACILIFNINLNANFFKIEITPLKKEIYLGDKVKFYLKIVSNEKIKSVKIFDNSTKFFLKEKEDKKVIFLFEKQFFTTGKVKIKPITIKINGIKIISNPIEVFVKSNLKKDSKFYDVKPPESVKFYLTRNEIIAIVIFLIILIFLVFIFFKLRKRKIKENDNENVKINYLLPFEEALENIKFCEKYLENGDVANFYNHLSYTLRKFLQRKKKIELLEATIEEIESKYSNEIPNELLLFLKKCDKIRFSGNYPEYAEIKKDFELLKDFIKNVENS